MDFTTWSQGPGYTSLTQILQKCDAGRPCTTCVNSGGESGCFYEELRAPNHGVIRSLEPLRAASGFPISDGLNVPGPSSGGWVSQPLFEEADGGEPSKHMGPQAGRPTRSSPDSSVPDPVTRGLVKLPSVSHVFGKTKHAGRSGPWYTPDPPLSSGGSRLSVLPSLRLPIIPPSFPAPLSFSCPENFQVTGEISADVEMSLYASFIASLVD